MLLLENWPFTDIYTEKRITGRYIFHADRAAKPLKFPQALEWEKSYKHKHKKDIQPLCLVIKGGLICVN